MSKPPEYCCEICLEDYVEDDNALIYCDGEQCNIGVHQACYGVPELPPVDKNWFCRRCEKKVDLKTRCCLCPSKKGAFKPTDTGSWAHVICGLYLPEVEFGSPTLMEPIIVSRVSDYYRNRECYICVENNRPKQSIKGCFILCNDASCSKAFHVTCAQKKDLLREEPNPNNPEEIMYNGYCSKHVSKVKVRRSSKDLPKTKSKDIIDMSFLAPGSTPSSPKHSPKHKGGSSHDNDGKENVSRKKNLGVDPNKKQKRSGQNTAILSSGIKETATSNKVKKETSAISADLSSSKLKKEVREEERRKDTSSSKEKAPVDEPKGGEKRRASEIDVQGLERKRKRVQDEGDQGSRSNVNLGENLDLEPSSKKTKHKELSIEAWRSSISGEIEGLFKDTFDECRSNIFKRIATMLLEACPENALSSIKAIQKTKEKTASLTEEIEILKKEQESLKECKMKLASFDKNAEGEKKSSKKSTVDVETGLQILSENFSKKIKKLDYYRTTVLTIVNALNGAVSEKMNISKQNICAYSSTFHDRILNTQREADENTDAFIRRVMKSTNDRFLKETLMK
eukprot:Nk52_evm3s239 gene=Nk52_evmTU3s239